MVMSSNADGTHSNQRERKKHTSWSPTNTLRNDNVTRNLVSNYVGRNLVSRNITNR
uniref:Uncharacterized protein n=1 Tax=Anguilla anguilla TaxID=7936 RepID=A0A0E9PAV6_ANGAN